MKLKLTTKNRLGLSQEVLAILAENNIDVKKVEVETGLICLETATIDKLLERTIATKLMKIDGVNWVESIQFMPAVQRNLFLTSLINAVPDPVFGINNKGQIIYQNNKAKECFKFEHLNKRVLKDIFTQENWAQKIDSSASEHIPVYIQTIAGSMLVEVRAIKQNNDKNIGAVMVFHRPENISTRSYVIQGADVLGFENLMCKNKRMVDLINRAKHMSSTQVPLLINGEAGVGKKTIAQAMHHASSRQNQLFSTIDCSNSKPLALEKELFGYAHHNTGKAGLLEIANGGTIYLQDVQEMSASCQQKLLDFLQANTFKRIGGKIERQADIKLIASSPLPLKEFVKNQQFNSELFYALDITQLQIPALRDRKDEIEDFIAYFLHFFKQQGGKNITELSFAALSKIKSYYWPGNLSQFKDVLYKASLLTQEKTIDEAHIEIDGHVPMESHLENRSLPQAVGEFEKHFLQHWYQKYPSTRKLAQQLGVSHTTIAQKLNKYGITQTPI